MSHKNKKRKNRIYNSTRTSLVDKKNNSLSDVKDINITVENKEQRKKISIDLNAVILAPIVAFLLGLISAYVVQYVFPSIFNKPDVTISPHNISYVKRGTISDTVGADAALYETYSAHLGANDKSDGNSMAGFIRGDANDPGSATIAVTLYNHGKNQAIFDGFYVELIDYRPLENIEYTLSKTGDIDDPNKFVVLYGLVNPLVEKSLLQPVSFTNENHIVAIDNNLLNIRLSPEEQGEYYLKIDFPKYGFYSLNISAYYEYKDKIFKAITKKPICIIYDDLTDEQIESRTKR